MWSASSREDEKLPNKTPKERAAQIAAHIALAESPVAVRDEEGNMHRYAGVKFEHGVIWIDIKKGKGE